MALQAFVGAVVLGLSNSLPILLLSAQILLHFWVQSIGNGGIVEHLNLLDTSYIWNIQCTDFEPNIIPVALHKIAAILRYPILGNSECLK